MRKLSINLSILPFFSVFAELSLILPKKLTALERLRRC